MNATRSSDRHLSKLWRLLTEPSASVQQADRRRQAQWLASLLVAIIAVAGLVNAAWWVSEPAESLIHDVNFWLSIIATLLLVVPYALSRTRHYLWGVLLTLGIVSAAIYGVAIPDYGMMEVYALDFLVLTVLLSSVLFSIRVTLIVAAGNIAAILLFPLAAIRPQVTFLNLFGGTLDFNIILSVVIILAAHLRNRLEQDRLTTLRESEEKHKIIFNESLDVILIIDHESGTILRANQSAWRILGYGEAELVGKNVLTLFPFAQSVFGGDFLKTFQVMGAVFNSHDCLRTDGTVCPMEVTATAIQWGADSVALVTLRDARQREQMEAERRADEHHHVLLDNISRSAASTLDFNSTMQMLADQLGELLQADGCYLTGWDEERQQTTPIAAYGPLREQYRKIQVPPGETTMTGSVMGARRVLVVEDVFNSPYVSPRISAQFPAKSLIGLPLIAGEQKLGAALISFNRPHTFTPEEVARAEQAAGSIALAVAKAQTFEAAQRRLKQVQALHTIDTAIAQHFDLHLTLTIVLQQVTKELGVDAADVLLVNTHSQQLEFAAEYGFRTQALHYTRLSPGQGHAGRAALERRIVNISDLQEGKSEFVRSPLLPEEGFVAYYGVPLVAKDQVIGVLETFHRAPLDPEQEWLDFLETLAGQAAIAIDNAALFADLQRSNAELVLAYDTTLEGWSRALELRDKETEGHTRRVTEMTMGLAKAMNVGSAELVHIRRGALLHDIGKMGVPDSILLKAGPLTPEEWAIMKQHPQYAYNMLSTIAFLALALDIPYCHHEKWDGSGYPRGLKGEQIPLAARIFAVVDVWDALRSDRPYRRGWPAAKVREHIDSLAGSHFDPQATEVFLREVVGASSNL